MYLLGAAAALFGLDQCLKQLVEGQSPERFPRSMDHTGGRIKLYRNHNRGFCFEVLKHRPSLVRQLPLCLTSMAGGNFVLSLNSEGIPGGKGGICPGACRRTQQSLRQAETGLCGRLLQHSGRSF